MNARTIKFLVISLSLHLAAIALFSRTGHFHSGMGSRMSTSGAKGGPLRVSLVPNTNVAQKPSSRRFEQAEAAAGSTSRTRLPEEAGDRRLDTGETSEYLPSGLLTRLPSPLTDIDLSDTAINEIGVDGELEVTLFIAANGRVTDALISRDINKNAQAFAEWIATLFKETLFIPGEINGKAVNSQIRVTIVSERLPAPDDR